MVSSDNILSVHNLRVSYSDSANVLAGISFSVRRGHIVSVMGTNGTGKTTLLKAISGMLRYDGGAVTEGDIYFKGKRINDLLPAQAIRNGIVHIIEGRREFSNLTIEENLSLGAFARQGGPSRAGMAMVYDYLPALFHRKKSVAADCGMGELQMLAIGRALMAQPELILLDEPHQRISPLLAEDLFTAITRINKEKGITFIFVERAQGMSFQVTDDVLYLSEGRIFRPERSTINPSGPGARL